MESFRGFRFSDMNQTVRKKRSERRPRNDTQPDYPGNSSLSSSPPSYDGSKGSSDENANQRRKELYLNQCNSRASYTNLTDSEINGSRNSGQSEVASDSKGNENMVKKVKLKVGGVVRTIHAKPTSDARLNQKLIAQENTDEDHSSSPDTGSGLQGIPWKDFSKSGFRVGKVVSSRDGGNILEESLSGKKSDNYEPVRKSKRVPKRRLLDGEEEDDDDEIRYLEKLKASKASSHYGTEFHNEDKVGSKKLRKISRVSNSNASGYNASVKSYGSSRVGKESNKSKPGREYEDTDYVEEEQLSDDEPEIERRNQRKEHFDLLGDSKREMAVTTRQQALQSGKDISTSSGAGLVEFLNGLPPAPPRKQKDKLSEVEQQLKKAEAAQRRRMQVEKAARESEAEAIRKILGQDSSRKKRENKMKQRQEELAQERTSNAMTLASNTVRWVIGPTGTVVTFPDDMGLPTIFESKPCSYPPPREKCVGPSCSNPYKYRDSRSKLPLCSLQCYKAVQEKMQSVNVCW